MSKRDTATIYVITCLANKRIYVGSAKRVEPRLKGHWTALAKGKHENQHLQKAWIKYGAESFSSCVLEVCLLGDRWRKEQQWIDKLGACDRRFGFNIMYSVRQTPPSAQMSKLLRTYWAGRWKDPEYAKKRTQELKNLADKPGVREKMRASKKANWQDPEYRRIQTEKHKEYARKNKGKLVSNAKALWQNPEYRAKQLAERKARFQDPAFRRKLSEAAMNRPLRNKKFIDSRVHNEIV